MEMISMTAKLLRPSADDVRVVTQQTLANITLNNFLKSREDEDEKND